VRPPLPIAPRHVGEPYRLGEYELPVGTLVAPCIYLLHRREDLYPEPERFRPERFLEQPPGVYTWIPFGGGARRCVGRSFATTEIKVVLRTLALKARLEPAEQRDEEMRRKGIAFSPSEGARAVLRERVPAAEAADVAVG
jgi:cytochrome P450